jgi:hypothetical protein
MQSCDAVEGAMCEGNFLAMAIGWFSPVFVDDAWNKRASGKIDPVLEPSPT